MVGFESRISQFTTVVIRVRPVVKGWRVEETGPRNGAGPSTEFNTKSDAMSYAMNQAESMPRAVVEVYGESGALEARSAYQTRSQKSTG